MQEALSPRLVQLSQGCPRLHLSFLCLQGAHERGTLFLFRTTRNWPSGDWPELDEDAEGGVGVMLDCKRAEERIAERVKSEGEKEVGLGIGGMSAEKQRLDQRAKQKCPVSLVIARARRRAQTARKA